MVEPNAREIGLIEDFFGTEESLSRCILEVNKFFGIIDIAKIIVEYGNPTRGFDYFVKMNGTTFQCSKWNSAFFQKAKLDFSFYNHQVFFNLRHCNEFIVNMQIQNPWQTIISGNVKLIQESFKDFKRAKKGSKFLARFILDQLTKTFLNFLREENQIKNK